VVAFPSFPQELKDDWLRLNLLGLGSQLAALEFGNLIFIKSARLGVGINLKKTQRASFLLFLKRALLFFQGLVPIASSKSLKVNSLRITPFSAGRKKLFPPPILGFPKRSQGKGVCSGPRRKSSGPQQIRPDFPNSGNPISIF